jgi:hypothetical protein
VFIGLLDGTVAALDDTTLEQLWKINVGSGFTAQANPKDARCGSRRGSRWRLRFSPIASLLAFSGWLGSVAERKSVATANRAPVRRQTCRRMIAFFSILGVDSARDQIMPHFNFFENRPPPSGARALMSFSETGPSASALVRSCLRPG